jgi:glycosyltransferase involved in cell wall biosynthesis
MHIIPTLNVGGAEKLLLVLCTQLRQRYASYEIAVTVLFDEHELAAELERNGISVFLLDMKRCDSFLVIFLRTYRAIRGWRPHIVHTHLYYADRYGQAAAVLAGVRRRISTIHNTEPHLGRQERLTRRITAAAATHIIAVCKTVRDLCVQSRTFARRKIRVIYNSPSFSSSTSRPRRLVSKPSSVSLINIGRPKKQKGQIFLIRAMEELKRSGIRFNLDIYGKTWDRGLDNFLRGEVERLDLDDIVSLQGTRSDMEAALQTADIMVSASLWEGLPLVVIEAMCVGLPVVVTDIPSHREVLEGIADVVFVEPGNPGALADAILALASDPARYSRLSAAEIKRAATFTISNMVSGHHNLYTEP